MAKCQHCGSTIVFGGKKRGESRYCDDDCRNTSILLELTAQVPESRVASYVAAVHQADCPHCKGPGPVDMHNSHWVWSALFITRYGSTPRICCRRCGRMANFGGMISSFLFGWWGFPFGLIFTPIQIFRNIDALARGPDPAYPSALLDSHLRLELANKLFGNQTAIPVSTSQPVQNVPRDFQKMDPNAQAERAW